MNSSKYRLLLLFIIVLESGSLIAQSKALKLIVVQKDIPLLKVLLPGQPDSDRGIEIEFPEHVTGLNEKTKQVEHLYLNTDRNRQMTKPVWKEAGNTFTYETELMNRVKMVAIAIMEPDGIRIKYQLTNHSDISYSNLQAVTCVKLYSLFSDNLLERTYVHHTDGFELIASETPERLTMNNWLPCRYLVSYTWPVAEKRVEKDGNITRYYKSRKADLPVIATLSQDKKWVAATFTKETGNLWTNPERSCHHADPAIDLKSGETKTLELKTFIFEGDLSNLLALLKDRKN
ncbi:hypothetical protein WSM22_09780 [Cytophagales bacterium WSM2-2]|nr:hypothetical protein WSM22_09780 [Cytophagales bacterium WSM2-2]